MDEDAFTKIEDLRNAFFKIHLSQIDTLIPVNFALATVPMEFLF